MVHDLSAQVPAAGAEGVQLEHLRHGHLGDQPRRHDHRFAQWLMTTRRAAHGTRPWNTLHHERKPSPASHKRTWRNTHKRYGTVAETMAQDNPAHGTRPRPRCPKRRVPWLQTQIPRSPPTHAPAKTTARRHASTKRSTTAPDAPQGTRYAFGDHPFLGTPDQPTHQPP